MELPAKFKVAWLYLVDNCDHAGIIDINPRLLSFMVGDSIDCQEFQKATEGRVVTIREGKWFIKSFIKFQYGPQLNPENSAHNGVLKRLAAYALEPPVPVINGSHNIAPSKGLASPCQGAKDKDKDKDSRGSAEGEKPIQLPDHLNTARMNFKWGEWQNIRRGFKKPKNWLHLFNEQIEWLSRFDEPTAFEILSASIRNGWQGLFEPKGKASKLNVPVETIVEREIRSINRTIHEDKSCL